MSSPEEWNQLFDADGNAVALTIADAGALSGSGAVGLGVVGEGSVSSFTPFPGNYPGHNYEATLSTGPWVGDRYLYEVSIDVYGGGSVSWEQEGASLAWATSAGPFHRYQIIQTIDDPLGRGHWVYTTVAWVESCYTERHLAVNGHEASSIRADLGATMQIVNWIELLYTTSSLSAPVLVATHDLLPSRTGVWVPNVPGTPEPARIYPPYPALPTGPPLLQARLGTDLAPSPEGWLYRCYRMGSLVKVERRMDPARSWVSVTAAADAAGDAAPTLCVDRHGSVSCWYHTSAGAAKCRRSGDCGATWSDWASQPGVKFPRARMGLSRMLLVGYAGSGLTVYGSADWGQTLASLATVPSVGAQLACLEIDRHGSAHLVYRDGSGRIAHQHQQGTGWSDPAVWAASGQYPALALGLGYGILSYWDSGSLVMKRLNGQADAVNGDLGAPTGAFLPGYAGLLIDGRGTPWGMGQQADGTPLLHYSGSGGALWLAS